MRPSGGKIEHVSRPKQPLLLRVEAPQDLQRRPGLERRVILPGNAPAAMPLALEQEDVVGVEVRADSSAGHRVAHHDVIEPGMGEEPERTQQRVGRGHFEIQALHQDGPAGSRQSPQLRARDRAFVHLPHAAIAPDDSRFDIGSRRERKQFRRLHDPLKVAHFEFFTNLAFVPGEDGERDTRAVWFEFDLAAFVEAIKAPHRYFQDTIKRQEAADRISKQLAAMDGKGHETSGADDDGDFIPGFEDDNRIALLKSIVRENLKWVAEAEGDTNEAGEKEYSIRERTVRGFNEIKRRWRAEADTGSVTKDRQLEILAKEQAEHRDDFGSATFYRELAKPEFHTIWRVPRRLRRETKP